MKSLFSVENLVLRARSEFNGFAGTGASCFGVLEYWRNRNSKSQIINIKQITMTKIQNSKPVLVIWCLEFDILQCSITPA
jgi:hypothetical protein